jgi:hypothetical protein
MDPLMTAATLVFAITHTAITLLPQITRCPGWTLLDESKTATYTDCSNYQIDGTIQSGHAEGPTKGAAIDLDGATGWLLLLLLHACCMHAACSNNKQVAGSDEVISGAER